MVPSGGVKYVQVNQKAPLFDELHNIVVKTFGLAGPLRTALGPLADRIELAVLYGSVAKGSDAAGSDIDLLVVADDLPLEALYAALEQVERKLARKISPALYTLPEFTRRRRTGHPFITRVLAGKHIVLLGNENGHSTAG